MSKDTTYYRVKPGTKTAKKVAHFWKTVLKQRKARNKFAKEVGARGHYGVSASILAFAFDSPADKPKHWVGWENKHAVFRPSKARSRTIPDDVKEIRRRMEEDYPEIGAYQFTHNDEYLGVGEMIMDGMTLRNIVPEAYGDDIDILAAPSIAAAKGWWKPDDDVVELKMSEYYTIKENHAESLKREKKERKRRKKADKS